jgi:hypothetical protein
MLDATRIAVEFVHVLPNLVVPTAMGLVIIWRQWRLEKHVDGRIDELKPLLVDRGRLEGLREAIPLAREDRKEFLEAALKTPTLERPEPVKPPPAPAPPKNGDEE